MAIDDRRGRDIDRKLEGVVVVFNASDEADDARPSRRSPAAATRCTPCRPAGGDPVVKQSRLRRAATGTFTVPARTVAVFVTR